MKLRISGRPSTRRHRLDGTAVVIGAVLLFLPATTYQLVWDDIGLLDAVQRTFQSSGWRGVVAAPFSIELGNPTPYYRPVVSSSMLIDAWLGGGQPALFHATNIALHAAASFLVWALAGLMVSSRIAALGAGLLFASHPVHVESVAFVSGRTDLWATVFVLLAVLAWWRARDLAASGRGWRTAAALLFWALACLSKENALLLPVVLLAWDLLDSRGTSIPGWFSRNRLWVGGSVLCIAAFLVVRLRVLSDVPIGPAPDRIAVATDVLFTYLRLLVVPWPANAFYTERTLPALPENLLFGSAFLALAGFTLARPVTRRRAALACVWFTAFLAPVLGLFSFGGALVAERFLYLPSVGAALLLAIAVEAPLSIQHRRLACAALGLLVVVSTILTSLRLPVWSDGISLYGDIVRSSPDYAPAYENLGVSLSQAGRHGEALAVLQQARALDPDYAGFHNGIGLSLAALGRTEEAQVSFRQAVELEPSNAQLWYNLGVAERALGHLKAAEGAYRNAARLNPLDANARINLGEVYLSGGRYREAAAEFDQAVRLDPTSAGAIYAGAVAHARSGGAAQARALAERLRAIAPEQAAHLERELTAPARGGAPERQ